MDIYFIAFIIFLSVFIQSLSGFGVAIISMALLPILMSIQTATPLIALVAISIEVILLIYYRQSLNIPAVAPIILAATIGIPIGIIFLRTINEDLIMTGLGVIITGYATYALLAINLPKLQHPAWAYGIGFFAGIFGGAYNVSGPPVIIYGNCKNWSRSEFKSNLQGFFLVTSLFVVIGHLIGGNITPEVLRLFFLSLPAIAIGIFAGILMDRYLSPEFFRKIVLVLLIVLGLRLTLIAII